MSENGKKVQAVCLYGKCVREGKPFRIKNKRGTTPKYCSDACRKKAYHDRHFVRISPEAVL